MGVLALAEATKCTGEPVVAPGEGELTETPAYAAAVMNKHAIPGNIFRIFNSTPGESFFGTACSPLLQGEGGDYEHIYSGSIVFCGSAKKPEIEDYSGIKVCS